MNNKPINYYNCNVNISAKILTINLMNHFPFLFQNENIITFYCEQFKS